MPQVVIENPVMNLPFAEPKRHFQFSDEEITNEIDEARRESAGFTRVDRCHISHVVRVFLEIRDPWDAENKIRTSLNPKKN